MAIEAGKTYFFTKSGNQVRTIAPTTPYRGEAMWEVERTAGASAGKGGPTIRRCMLFAKALGHGALCMANLFAFRATRSAGMLAATDPFGPDK
ncbi:DUF1643 domain-containing protein [Janthinobacterium sp. RB2R34]|uniref:DUF1643 domain-containing protein n=1 Tax=Janthinobacterium sp. RB2R34 TaxID=3424193 RepID=UPI003F24898E